MENRQFITIPELENRTFDEISNGIENFKTNIFHENMSFKDIKREVKKLSLGYKKENYYWFRFKDGFYRARKHEEEWKKKHYPKTGELWYRDWTNVDKSKYRFGRLTHPGENFMYLSTSRIASIIEVEPNEGDWVTVANIVPFNKTKLNLCLVAEDYLRQASPDLNNFINVPNKGIRRLDDNSFKKLKLIDDFLIELFTAKIEKENDFKYKSSIAVWEYLRELNFSIENSGILYPSIAFNNNAINVGLFPKIVDSNYGIDLLITFVVESLKKQKNSTVFDIHPIKIGTSTLLTSGSVKIDWRNPNSEEIKAYSTIIEYKNTKD